MKMVKKILMVCMGKICFIFFYKKWKAKIKNSCLLTGNICRSPIAEAVMERLIEEKGLSTDWFVDSAALVGYHSGSQPDERALSVLEQHGLRYNKVARTIQPEDFEEFDYIFGMDLENVADLKRKQSKQSKAQILLLGDFGLKDSERSIHDPYYVSRIYCKLLLVQMIVYIFLFCCCGSL